MITAKYNFWPTKNSHDYFGRGTKVLASGSNAFGVDPMYGEGVTPLTQACCDYQTDDSESADYIAPCCVESYFHGLRPFSMHGHVLGEARFFRVEKVRKTT